MLPSPENLPGEGKTVSLTDKEIQHKIDDEVFRRDEEALLTAIFDDLGITEQRFVEAEDAYFGSSGATPEQVLVYRSFIAFSELIRTEQSLMDQSVKRLPPLDHLTEAFLHIPAVIDYRNTGLVDTTLKDAINEINSLTSQAPTSVVTNRKARALGVLRTMRNIIAADIRSRLNELQSHPTSSASLLNHND